MSKSAKQIHATKVVRLNTKLQITEQSERAILIARTILKGFEKHFTIYQSITAGAQERFEKAQWQEIREAARERIHYYDKRTQEAVDKLRIKLHITHLDNPLWKEVKLQYVDLLLNHLQPELAESFYNSVFCRLFDRRYYNNNNIFVRSSVSVEYLPSDAPTYRTYYPARIGLQQTIKSILLDADINLPFEDLRRDIRNIMLELARVLPKSARFIQMNYQIDVLSSVFFRNKGAYLIGRVINGNDIAPFIVPILNNERGGVYVDALLLERKDVHSVFGFTRAYFMVDAQVPSATVEFLMNILPGKSKADLYSAIGFHKHGKTAFYRDFLNHLAHSSDEFVEAPGIRGMVMMVFTLPSYQYVFKIIKDAFDPPKNFSRSTVIEKYRLVKQHDRIGRLADTLEYSDVALPKERFNSELLATLLNTCSTAVVIEDDYVILKHVYIEHRMTPLDLLLKKTTDKDELLYFARGYGDAIREMAAGNIFPGDMLLKNFGVTKNRRVVFYDYDEIRYLTECNIRKLPPSSNPHDDFAAVPWFSVCEDDIFPEEFERYFLANPAIANDFAEHHGELMTVEFWRGKQRMIEAGELEEVIPYPRSIRFSRPKSS